MDLSEDVADHIENRYKGELQGVVDHHVDEHDVPWVLIKETIFEDKQELRRSL